MKNLFLLCLLALVPGWKATADDMKRPNIVFILSDDHAYQAISSYGDPRNLIQTPNIDRIANEGMRFDRCLVANSICGPSRATILTGTYNHINKFTNNANCVFDGTQTTFPKLLQAAGYQTAVIGKWHLVSDPTGFDFWQVLPGQGVYYNPPMNRLGTPITSSGYVTQLLTDASLDWLKARDKSRPFFLMCGNKAPHGGWEPAAGDLDFDGGRKYPKPDTLFDDYKGRGIAEQTQDMTIAKTLTDDDLKLNVPKDLSPAQRVAWNAYYDPRNAAFLQKNLSGKRLVKWKYQRFMHDYLGCVKAVDDNVGRVLKYLDDEGLSNNTIVIYTSDQGFYLGEHGWFDKRWIFDQSLRTPLIVRWPGVVNPGTVNNAMVSNLDLAETFLDAAGLPAPGEMQGRSLTPVLKGETPPDWRKSFYYQYYEYPDPHHVHPHYGVVTKHYKLVHFYGTNSDYWEMFDLKKDPSEMKSVYNQPEYAHAQSVMLAKLTRLRAELKVPETIPPQWFGKKVIEDMD